MKHREVLLIRSGVFGIYQERNRADNYFAEKQREAYP